MQSFTTPPLVRGDLHDRFFARLVEKEEAGKLRSIIMELVPAGLSLLPSPGLAIVG